MTVAHVLGFPRMGVQRELKRALERYWKNEIPQEELLATAKELRARHWALQRAAGMDVVPVNDFCMYDHMLDMSALLGVVPPRYEWAGGEVDLDTYFRMARGMAPTGKTTTACEMTKWFDTNYHYIVPEFVAGQTFKIARRKLFDEVAEAQALGLQAKPVLVGPLTYLWLGKVKGEHFDKLKLLDSLLPVYVDILKQLKAQGCDWVQIDEPALVLDLPADWKAAYMRAYQTLAGAGVKLLLATYFEGLRDNTALACTLPVAGLHVDLVRAPQQLDEVLKTLPADKVLSLGVIDCRNIWRADLDAALAVLKRAASLGERVWVSASCSLLHTPVDLDAETRLYAELKGWLAFAKQK